MGVVHIGDATQAGTGHMPQAHTYVITHVCPFPVKWGLPAMVCYLCNKWLIGIKLENDRVIVSGKHL